MEAAHQSQSRAGRRVPPRALAALSVVLALAAGLGLRLWMLKQFFEVNGDSLIYGELAKNLLLHGRYAFAGAGGQMNPTLIRLPGYPLFLALCFRVFGMENYASAAWVQIALELAGCLMLADFAGRIVPAPMRRGTAHCTLWLAALCPFTAVYAAEPLSEAPTLFVLALALWSAARFRERPGWAPALSFTFAAAFAALLRPDGALATLALAPSLLIGLGRRDGKQEAAEESRDSGQSAEKHTSGAKEAAEILNRAVGRGFIPGVRPMESTRALAPEACFSGVSPEKQPFSSACKARVDLGGGIAGTKVPACHSRSGNPKLRRMAFVCLLLALAPFAAWTGRNWAVFHVFQPLAPRYANEPGQPIYPGWQRWVKSWSLDFVSTYEIYWNVPGSSLDLTKLPSRAFDSPAQYAETAALADDYNVGQVFTPEIDARFDKLAGERIATHPLRYYVWLPLARMADMWVRPRVENLNIDLDWWVYAHHHVETRFSWAYAGLNALYLLLGFAGLCLRPRFWRPMLAYFLLRSALLTTIEAPEARYTLECFPMLFALGGVALYRLTNCVLLSVLKVKASAGSA